ncbi:MAG: adenylyl-sulfate kinase [Desulfovibrio sp.]|nr:adenylyl-sulfate kinase [Desulfovibrio sp.]
MHTSLFPTQSPITRADRQALLGQGAFAIWLYGLSGSGKTTIAYHLEQQLFHEKILVYCLDGDNIRNGLCRDLSFTQADRTENLRRVAEVVKLFLDAGILCIASFITPKESDRAMIKEILGSGNVIDVYLQCSLNTCAQRDVKQLYKMAQNNRILNFTGVSSLFEPPEQPSLVIDTEHESIEDCVNAVYRHCFHKG